MLPTELIIIIGLYLDNNAYYNMLQTCSHVYNSLQYKEILLNQFIHKFYTIEGALYHCIITHNLIMINYIFRKYTIPDWCIQECIERTIILESDLTITLLSYFPKYCNQYFLNLSLNHHNYQTINYIISNYNGKLNQITLNTCILLCVKNNHLHFLQLFHHLGGLLKHPKLLSIACKNNTSQIIQYLLSHNFPIVDHDGHAIINACESSNTATVQLLLEHIPHDHPSWENGLIYEYLSTGLISSIRKNNSPMVSFLLSQGAIISFNNHSPIIVASSVSNVEIIEILLSSGSDPNAQNGKPLINACIKSRYDIVKSLLSHGANPNLDNTIALEYACCSRDIYLVKLLIEFNANPCVNDNSIFKSALRNCDYELLSILTKNINSH